MHLVTYGSLMFDEVMFALLNRNFESEVVSLKDYARFKMAGQLYPGLIWTPGEQVEGRAYFDLDQDSLELLDIFEDDAYERTIIKVKTQTRGEIEARAYTVSNEHRNFLTKEAWSPHEFNQFYLQDYLAMCRRFRKMVKPS